MNISKSSLSHQQLGISERPFSLSTSQDNYTVMASMLQQSRQSVEIYTHRFDGKLFDNSEISQAIRQMISQNPHAQVRILLMDAEPLIKYGHRIIELSRRLSSHIMFKTIAREYKNHIESFMIFDTQGIIFRKNADRYEGIARFNDKKYAKELRAFFDEVWEVSEADPNFRRLHI